jgi:hypothetical protein
MEATNSAIADASHTGSRPAMTSPRHASLYGVGARRIGDRAVDIGLQDAHDQAPKPQLLGLTERSNELRGRADPRCL